MPPACFFVDEWRVLPTVLLKADISSPMLIIFALPLIRSLFLRFLLQISSAFSPDADYAFFAFAGFPDVAAAEAASQRWLQSFHFDDAASCLRCRRFHTPLREATFAIFTARHELPQRIRWIYEAAPFRRRLTLPPR